MLLDYRSERAKEPIPTTQGYKSRS
jgi:hypothetical protein